MVDRATESHAHSGVVAEPSGMLGTAKETMDSRDHRGRDDGSLW